MDDERLRARVRAIDAPIEPRPAFVRDLEQELAARLGFADTSVVATGSVVPSGVLSGGGRGPRTRRLALLAAAALLLLALVANAAAIGAFVQRLVDPPALLETVRGSGELRIAVQPNAPQAAASRGMDGFDLDVAKALAARIGAGAQVLILSPDAMLERPGDGWQAGLPGIGLDAAASGNVLVTRPYYAWPVYLVGRAGSGPATLDGTTVCVANDTPGAAWAAGATTGPALEVARPLPGARFVARPDEQACVQAVLAGEADALATVTMLPIDLQTDRRLALLLDAPVAVEPRRAVVPADAAGSGPMRDALDAAIAELIADGTLADLARARFGTDEVVPDR